MLHHIVGCLLLVLYVQGLPHKDELCSHPSETGPCRASIRRYYYNSNTEKCEKFIYGGCKGNANNFKSLSECNERCGKHVAGIASPIHPCPDVQCNRDCKYGYKHDIHGCNTCTCKPSHIVPRIHPCPEVQCNRDCKYGYTHDIHGCNSCTCKPSPKPVCGHVCMIACPHGNVLNKHRCPTCRCRPGPPFPCPMFRCPASHCPFGHAHDKRGCMTCGCNGNPHPTFPPRQRSCPKNAKSNIGCPVMHTHDECTGDEDCSFRKKCCTFGCSKKCIRPRYERPTWLYK